jgi:hypothetical protein
MIRLKMVCIALAVASAAGAQDPANSLTGFQQTAARRTAEWTTLTVNLEQRVARLLPCDARVRGAIEETSRASEARTVASTTYWLALSGVAKTQVDAIRRLQAQEEAGKETWTVDRTEAGEELAAVAQQSGFLAISANRLPALGDAQKSLSAAAQALRQIESQIQAREASADQLIAELRDLLAAGLARQNAIEAQLRFISTEGSRWSAYYDARLKRAQTECFITNPGAGGNPRANPAVPPAIRKKP